MGGFQVSGREPEENKATEGEIAPSRLLSNNLKLLQANLQKTGHRGWKQWLGHAAREIDQDTASHIALHGLG